MSNSDWAMLGALGQWAGAIATFAAVVVALGGRRPKLLVRAFEGSLVTPGQSSRDILWVEAANVGTMPVKITGFGFRGPRNQKSVMIVPQPDGPPILLSPGDSTRSWTYEMRIKDEYGLDVAEAFHSAGRRYLAKIGLLGGVRRWRWLNFGKLPRHS